MGKLYALTVPKWGMSMEEGEIAEWRVAVGDRVAIGDEIVDIETSKIINTAESTCTGTLVRQVANSGDVLKVAELLGVVADGEVSEADIDAFIATFVPAAAALNIPLVSAAEKEAAPPPTANPAAAPTPSQPVPAPAAAVDEDVSSGPDDREVKASVVARRIARAHNINLHRVTGTGRHGRVSKWDVEKIAGMRIESARADRTAPPLAPMARPPAVDDAAVASTPVARRLARELNISLNDVVPTGRRNRVTKEDVEQAAIARTGMPRYREQKLDAMRKTIASRLSESTRTIPHYRVSMDVEVDSLLQQRAYMNDTLGHSLSLNDFVLKAAAAALQQVPEVNVQWAGDSVLTFDRADIAMAIAVSGGLVAPVIRDVAGKSLPAIAAEARELATRAQAGTLTVDELQGGTFSVSNLGMYGVDQFDAVISLPQAAILAVAAAKKQAVVKGDAIVAARVMRVTLSSDHRLIDGAVSARFLQSFKGFMENPASMLL